MMRKGGCHGADTLQGMRQRNFDGCIELSSLRRRGAENAQSTGTRDGLRRRSRGHLAPGRRLQPRAEGPRSGECA